MTKSKLRDLLDEAGLSVIKDSDGDYRAILIADEDFRYNVDVAFVFNEANNRIEAMAFSSSEFDVDSSRVADAVLFCNSWNSKVVYGRSFVKNNRRFIFEMTLACTPEPSDEYVIAWLKRVLGVSWAFFKDAGQEF